MHALRRMVASRPVTSYFVLTFAISWAGFLAAVGPGGFHASSWQTSARFPLAVAAMLAGPSISGLLHIGLLDGAAGMRELGRRLVRWRVAPGWYVFALVTAPVLAGTTLLALSIRAPIFTSPDKAGVIGAGVAAGLTTVLEEVGWTGFAIPRLRQRHGTMATALLVGVVWAGWHFLQGLFITGTYAGELPPALFVALNTLGAIVQLTAYRVLLVWLHDRTQSLLVVTLMHASLTASTIFVFVPLATGWRCLAYGWALAAALWCVAAVVMRLGRTPRDRRP